MLPPSRGGSLQENRRCKPHRMATAATWTLQHHPFPLSCASYQIKGDADLEKCLYVTGQFK
jgi:hypothetical protein